MSRIGFPFQTSIPRISPCLGAAQAYEVAQYILEQKLNSILVVVPNAQAASSITIELRLWLKTDSVVEHQEWDPAPWSGILPSLKSKISRLKTLKLLTNTRFNPPAVVVSSLAGALQKQAPLNRLSKESLFLKRGSSFESRRELVSRLISLGYSPSEIIEDVGTFSFRGEILDIFDPGALDPCRIEFFDTSIESIRNFSIHDQRSKPDLIDEVCIFPFTEILPSAKDRLSKKIKFIYDHRNIHRGIRDPLLDDLRAGKNISMSDYFIPWAYPENETLSLLEMIQFEAVLFIDFEQINHEITRLANRNEEHPHLPTISELYSFEVAIKAKHGGVFFDPLKWQSSETTFHEITSNSVEIEVDSSLENCISKTDPRIHEIQLYSSNAESLGDLRVKAEKNSETYDKKISFIESDIPASIADFKKQLSLIPAEKFSTRTQRRLKASSKKEHWMGLDSLSSLMINDPVVHRDHGIGFFRGTQHMEISGIKNEFLLLEYESSDRLYLPVYNINLIQKYHGSTDVTPDRLGGAAFIKAKNDAKSSAQRLAINLLELYAKRAKTRGFLFSKPDDEYFKMVESFPFSETRDQSNAIQDVLDDMTSGKLMDRIVCGDVGFGKTEIAIRAAFKAVLDKKQVVVLCPTTLLAFQHEQSFKSRLSDFGVIVESISRFKSRTEQKKILQSLSDGKIDILIGTHRILSKDVAFYDLGLVVVDEEHRFGVEHKEKLRSMSSSVSTLTLTATPIPRTLNMALSGLRDISLIQTPPSERLSIKTYLCGFEEDTLANAIRSELQRGGQVFFVHNRIKDLDRLFEIVKKWVPESRPVIAHGQMDEKVLEETILKFYSNAANILICTSIIESGIDLPNANTIIIHNANHLGLAQLYQIRGRVGRGSQRAFAYLVVSDYSKLTDDAKKRLNVIERFVELGSGFSIATHDLEIRGGGNFLGPEQSGHVAAIGLEMYSELLDEAIASLRGSVDKDFIEPKEPEIKIPFPCYFPDGYIDSSSIKLMTYRKLSRCVNDSEVYELKSEISDRFGRLPTEASNLIELVKLKIFLKQYGVEALVVGPEKTTIKLSGKTPLSLEKTIAIATTQPNSLQITPDSKLVIKLAVIDIPTIRNELEKLFDYLN